MGANLLGSLQEATQNAVSAAENGSWTKSAKRRHRKKKLIERKKAE